MSSLLNYEPMIVEDHSAMYETISAAMPKDQFLRELVQNSIESGATEIHVDVYWPYIDEDIKDGIRPRYKLCVADNGRGMSAEEMKRYIGRLSSGEKKRGAQGNFGIGAKISTLEVSPSGVEYMSWQHGQTGNYMVINKNPVNGAASIWRWTDQGGDLTIELDESAKMGPVEEHGTIVIIDGVNENDNTFLPRGDDGLLWLTNYMNRRYYALPGGITLKVRGFRGKNLVSNYETDESIELPLSPSTAFTEGQGFLTAHGARKILIENWADHYGEMELHGAKLHWYTRKDKPTPQSEGYKNAYSSALYKGELYDVCGGGPDRITNNRMYRHQRRMMLFDIPFGSTKICIIVEPDPSMIQSDMKRTMLTMNDGTELPWEDWGAEFSTMMPDEIREIIDDEMSSRDRKSETEIDDKVRDAIQKLDPKSFITKKGGEFRVLGDDAGGERTGMRRRNLDPEPVPTPHGRKRKQRIDPEGVEAEMESAVISIPEFAWVWPSQEEDQAQLAGKAGSVSETPNGFFIYGNREYILVDSIINQIMQSISKSGTDSLFMIDIVTAEVELEFKFNMKLAVARFIELHVRMGAEDWAQSQRESVFSPEGVTAIILGAHNDIMISAEKSAKYRIRTDSQKQPIEPEPMWENVGGIVSETTEMEVATT